MVTDLCIDTIISIVNKEEMEADYKFRYSTGPHATELLL